MGQKEIIEFLEKEYFKDPNKSFTKEEIEKVIGKSIKYYSLNSMADFGEIERQVETIRTNKCKFKRYKYRYLPNGPFLIKNFRR
ncbi:MAG: hypothetical protein QXD55_00475 [Candidatus Aenigmatarchaeota archaeon]